MIRLDCQQRSAEWVQARLGIPTASQFGRIITPKTGKPSAQSDTYLAELVAEYCLGVPLERYASQFMQRGTDLELQAVRYYELQRDLETEAVGLVLRGDRMVACSPDRLVGEDGGLEIKVPAAGTHVGYLLGDLGLEYTTQVQGAMWLTGRSWWDLLSYHPTLPPALVRIERNEAFIKDLAAAVDAFVARLLAARERMKALGWKPPPEPPTDRERAIATILALASRIKVDHGEDARAIGGWDNLEDLTDEQLGEIKASLIDWLADLETRKESA